jgi:hypothetical protein
MRQTSWIALFERFYRALLILYPAKYRLEYGSAMVQVFRDMCRNVYHEQGQTGLARWWVVTLTDLVRTAIEQHIEERSYLRFRPGQGRSFNMTTQKWGALASFVLAASLLISGWIYLTGNLREPNGALAYDLADLLYGPVRAVCLIAAGYALRVQIGERAPRLMSLMLVTAVLAAAMFVMAALFRSTNRHYHLMHPELGLESSSIVLTAWATLVGGVVATGWHFLGWSMVLLGSAGWASGRIPRVLSVLYWVVGAASLIVYLLPETEMNILVFAMALSIWQGLLLWRAAPEQPQPLTVNSESA